MCLKVVYMEVHLTCPVDTERTKIAGIDFPFAMDRHFMIKNNSTRK